MPYWLNNSDFHFPPPYLSDDDGLLAVGGDLNPIRLLKAYASGIFPWYSPDSEILWWSPNPRMIFFNDDFHISRTLQRKINSRHFQVKMDTCFQDVIQQCANVNRKEEDGTWIIPEMQQAYAQLHQLGYAHSVEVFENQQLVGGLYGISLGKAFFGESMFHLQSDASKVALFHLVEFSKKHNFLMIDAQMNTQHLQRMGAKDISRDEYLLILQRSLKSKTLRGKRLL